MQGIIFSLVRLYLVSYFYTFLVNDITMNFIPKCSLTDEIFT